MKLNKILDITIPTDSKRDILEKIKKYLYNPKGFYHIVSLNPENLVVAKENKTFKEAIETAQIKIIDGAGVVLAARVLNIDPGERLTGVELMEELIRQADKIRLRVLLIGGKPDLALRLAQCYRDKMLQAEIKGTIGIKNIKKPEKAEEEAIFSIVSDFRPHIVFVAFGSPDQELWLYRHRDQFKDCLCMGVGGAFDYLTGEIARAPMFLRKIGLEWLFRLFVQPWRWRRQLRLVEFLFLVFKQRFLN